MKKHLLILVAILVTVVLMTTNVSYGAIQTFGQTTDNGSVQTNSTDRKYVNAATPSSGGQVVSGVARIWNTGTLSSNSNLVIYSDNAGAPDALLATSDTVALATGGSETAVNYTFSGANQITISGSTQYWIGVHFSDPGTGNINISRANVASLVRSDSDTYSDGPADPCACTTLSNGALDIYIEYDDAPGGGGGGSATTTASFRGGVNIKGGVTIK